MKRILIFLSVFLPALVCLSQSRDTITLDHCYQEALKNFPLAKQAELLGKSTDLKLDNLNKNYLPQVTVGGSASLQSEVTNIALKLPANFPPIGLPSLSKDWYKLTVDANQSIYDGNLTRYQKKLETLNLSADEKNLEIALYTLKDRINQIFFSIFLLQENESLLTNVKSTLEAKMKEVHSAVTNGAMLSSAEDALQVELYKTDQQLTELKIDRTNAFQILSELTSTNIPETSFLVLPSLGLASLAFENKRPEVQLFDLQKNKLDLMKAMVITKWNPRLYAFGEVGYGRPGFNMLSNDFTPWWIVGAKLNWAPWNWNQNKNEKKILTIQQEIIQTQKETFDKNTRIEASHGLSEITKLSELLKKDGEILALREKITKTAASQMENGVITTSEYISRLNEETQARLSLELHKIQQIKAQISYFYIIGK